MNVISFEKIFESKTIKILGISFKINFLKFKKRKFYFQKHCKKKSSIENVVK